MAKIQIFLFGLNKVGKTTLVEYFREKKFIPQSPTIGVSISQIVFSNLTLEFTDVGGQKRFRKDWENYLKRPHIMVYVIDASDRDEQRIQDGRNELHKLMVNPKTTGIPLLILINKIDLEMVMLKDIVEKRFGLNKITGREVAVYEASAKTGKNLDAALNAMTTMVLKDEGIEYLVSEKVKEQSRQLLVRYKKFYSAGQEAFKMGNLEQSLASLSLSKEIASNLFQLGILPSGRNYKKLSNLIAKIERNLEAQEKKTREEDIARMQEEKKQSTSGLPTGLPSGLPTGPPGKPASIPSSELPLTAQLKGASAAQTQIAAPVMSKEKKLRDASIHVFGTDKAGVSMFKNYFSQEKFAVQAPLTINIPTIVLKNLNIEFNDFVEPQDPAETLAGSWKEPEIFVFIVDALVPDSFDDARRNLHQTINKPHVKSKPVLILVNNFDSAGAQPVAFMDSISELKRMRGKDVGIFEVSLKYEYNLEEPLNFLISIFMKDKVVEKFVSSRLDVLIANFKEMYQSFLKEAKVLEKEGKFQHAYNRVAKAKLIQEEMFKYASKLQKVQKEIKKCDELMSKLRMKSLK
ncbi:MAG: ADP-ribosylation factor-like protein [Promethearchaeota archaeon]